MNYHEISEDALIDAIIKMHPFSCIRFNNGKVSRFNYETQNWIIY